MKGPYPWAHRFPALPAVSPAALQSAELAVCASALGILGFWLASLVRWLGGTCVSWMDAPGLPTGALVTAAVHCEERARGFSPKSGSEVRTRSDETG